MVTQKRRSNKMKTIFMAAALVLTFSTASFAEEEMTVDQSGIDLSYPNRPGDGHPGWGNPGRQQIQCVARNFRGQRFVGVDRMQQRAANEALRQCQRRSGFLGRTCRLERCVRVGGR
jgi:hypothetical protein